MNKPVVFLDADVIFAGAAAPTEHGASHVVLRLGEITLLDCVTSTQVVTEVERNLAEKLPDKLPTLRLILSRSLRVVADPEPQELAPYKGQADPKDLPILVAALQQGKKEEARQMLAEIYNWFTEGFDTKDLQEAKVLLSELER